MKCAWGIYGFQQGFDDLIKARVKRGRERER